MSKLKLTGKSQNYGQPTKELNLEKLEATLEQQNKRFKVINSQVNAYINTTKPKQRADNQSSQMSQTSLTTENK